METFYCHLTLRHNFFQHKIQSFRFRRLYLLQFFKNISKFQVSSLIFTSIFQIKLINFVVLLESLFSVICFSLIVFIHFYLSKEVLVCKEFGFHGK